MLIYEEGRDQTTWDQIGACNDNLIAFIVEFVLPALMWLLWVSVREGSSFGKQNGSNCLKEF